MKTKMQKYSNFRTVLLHLWDVRWIAFSKYWKSAFQTWLDQHLAALCTPPPLQVWYTYDELEQLWWSAFDPATGQRMEQVTEAEIKAWIENQMQGRR